MGNKVTRRFIAGIITLILLSGCGGQAYIPGVVKNAPELTAVAQQQPDNDQPNKDFVLIWEVFGTPTPDPTRDARLAAAAAAAANRPAQSSPTRVQQSNVSAGNLLPGDPSRGEMVFMGAGTCMTCHDTTNNMVIVGPSLIGVSQRAGKRVQGKTADEYLHESILNPNAYVVEGFNPVMPQHFGTALTQQQIEDLIAYLKSL